MFKQLTVITFFLALALGACEMAKPFDYAEFDQRPGLFTGEDGEWVIYRK